MRACKTLRTWDALGVHPDVFPWSTFMGSTPQGKLNWIRHYVAYGGVGISLRIHKLRATWRWEANFIPRPLYPWQWNACVYRMGAFLGPPVSAWKLWRRQNTCLWWKMNRLSLGSPALIPLTIQVRPFSYTAGWCAYLFQQFGSNTAVCFTKRPDLY